MGRYLGLLLYVSNFLIFQTVGIGPNFDSLDGWAQDSLGFLRQIEIPLTVFSEWEKP